MKKIKKLMTFPEAMFEQLKAEATRTGLAVTEILRRAVDAYFRDKR